MPQRPKAKSKTPAERTWAPPEKSDQPPGEEVVQVNDAYLGGSAPPEAEPIKEEQHPTGG